MRAKSLLAASVGLVLGFAATQAGAFSLKAHNGEVLFKFSAFTTENNTQPGTNETTWGAGFITQILDAVNPSNVIWQPNDSNFGNETIGFMLYGIADGNITTGGFPNPINIFNVGCTGAPCDDQIHLDLYLNPTGFDFTTTSPNASGRGFNTLPGITDGTPLMQWQMVRGIVAVNVTGGTDPLFDEKNTTLYQNATDATLTPTINGLGSFYANCVGGSCAQFASGAYTTALNTKADFKGNFTLVPAAGVAPGWGGNVNDPVRAKQVPEPASLALLGSGLLGLITLRRRRENVA